MATEPKPSEPRCPSGYIEACIQKAYVAEDQYPIVPPGVKKARNELAALLDKANKTDRRVADAVREAVDAAARTAKTTLNNLALRMVDKAGAGRFQAAAINVSENILRARNQESDDGK